VGHCLEKAATLIFRTVLALDYVCVNFNGPGVCNDDWHAKAATGSPGVLPNLSTSEKVIMLTTSSAKL